MLSKQGLVHYTSAIANAGIDATAAAPGAIVPLPLNVGRSFASTIICGSIVLVGFLLLLVVFGNNWRGQSCAMQ